MLIVENKVMTKRGGIGVLIVEKKMTKRGGLVVFDFRACHLLFNLVPETFCKFFKCFVFAVNSI